MSVFGVDFGNLNSTVAITRYGGVDIVTNEVSKRETTTMVTFVDDERFIGEQALDRYVRNAPNTVFLLKRFIGMHMSDPQMEHEKRFLTCEIKAGADDRLMFGVYYSGETQYFYPEQILAMMLQKLRTYVNEAATVDAKFPADVRDFVITVPCYYTADQRRLMYQAAETASMNCLSLINETTASAVDYGIFRGSSLRETEGEGQIVGVLDIGYGATDFSVTKFWRGNCKILAQSFDRNNGTRDIDYELYKHMCKEVQTRYKVDVTGNARARLRLLQGCERIKYLLSSNSTAPMNIENLMDVDVNIPSFDRATLEDLSKDILARIRAVLDRGMAEAGVSIEEFHSIEMIGGGCRIPMFKKLVEDLLGRPPSFTLNASEATARGCAITAAMLSPKFQVREFRMAELPSYPILLGYAVENPKSPSSVAFLPDVNKVVTLLSGKDSYPKLLDVTIPRTGPFKLYAFYNPDDETVKRMVQPGHYVIGEWEIGAPIGKAQGVVGETKVRINIRPDGLLQVEGATAIDTYEVEEVVDIKDAAAAAPATAAKDAAPPATKKGGKRVGNRKKATSPATAGPTTTATTTATTANEEEEGEDASAEDEEATATTTVVKRKMRSLDCSVRPNLAVLGHSSEAVVVFRATERIMHDRDTLITHTREKKNELESYILEFRPRLSEGGSLLEYVATGPRADFIAKCAADEEWLYEDGENATAALYQERISALRAIGDPAQARYRNLEDVQFAVKGFTEKMRDAAKQCDEARGRKAHVTDEDLDAARKIATDAAAWAVGNATAMATAAKTEPQPMTPQDMRSKAEEVARQVRMVINKPAPPPPKPATPPPTAPAAAAPEVNEEEEAKPAEAAEAAPEATANENEEAKPAPVELD